MTTNPRLEALRDRLDSAGVDGFLISAPENRRYLSGFSGSAGSLLVTRDEAVLATDFRYVEQAGQQAPDFRVHRVDGRITGLGELIARTSLGRLGIESDDMSVADHHALSASLQAAKPTSPPELIATSGIVDDLRAVKDQAELALIEKAVEIADTALARVAPAMEPGMTEKYVAWEIEKAMRELGAEAIAFDIIVGAGPNGALPHHRADDTVVRPGDSVVIDMGATYEGYRSDLTRTFAVGEPKGDFRRVYDTVLGAQTAAEEAVSPGITGGELDAVARDFIAGAGYGDHFGHGLGHGVGLAVHERPRVAPASQDVLEEGMVFTIEPGIYLPGWGGVRIEDIVTLQNGRARVLTRSSK
jgi:Xaa-Pro aminopeptidase